MNTFTQINHTISENLNNFVQENNLEKIIGFFADAPIFFLPIFFVGTWIFYEFFLEKKISKIRKFFLSEKNILEEKNSEKSKLLIISYGIIFAILTSIFIQQFSTIERPDSIIKPILEHIPDASFPSDHATVSFAFLFGILFFGYKKTFFYFLPFVILMNFSRIAGGLHWFFDVFVGMLIGLFFAYFFYKIRKNIFVEKVNNFFINLAKFFKL